MDHLITLDVGTTSVKTCMFDERFRLVKLVSSEYELLTPAKDVVEMDPDAYWRHARQGIRQVVDSSGVNPDSIKAICLTTQGETLIPVDGNGREVHNALVWLDARAVEEVAVLNRQISNAEFYAATGIPEIGPACPVCKVLWFKRNRPDIFNRTARLLLLEDFLIHRLTGVFATHKSLMSSTGYFDIVKETLWQKALDVVGIGDQLFPEVLDCGTVAGTLRPPVASELGLHSHTKVVAGAMDQIAAALAAGNTVPGMLTETTGTALVIGATMDRFDPKRTGGVTVYKHFDRKFLMLPYCATAGIILKWFRDEFCADEAREAERTGASPYDLLTAQAEDVEPGAGGLLLVPHFAGKMNPDVNPSAKGVFFGVGLESKKRHFIRAILEGIGYMLRENVEMIERTGIRVGQIRSLGGGSKSRLWSTIKADTCGKDIVTMEQTEATSVGAAILGLVTLGVYPTVDDACRVAVKTRDVYHPDSVKKAAYGAAYAKYLEVYEKLRDSF
jgi:xylulokinase